MHALLGRCMHLSGLASLRCSVDFLDLPSARSCDKERRSKSPQLSPARCSWQLRVIKFKAADGSRHNSQPQSAATIPSVCLPLPYSQPGCEQGVPAFNSRTPCLLRSADAPCTPPGRRACQGGRSTLSYLTRTMAALSAAPRALARAARGAVRLPGSGNPARMSAGSACAASKRALSMYAIPHVEFLPNSDTSQRVVFRGSAGREVSPWHDVPAFVPGTADVHMVVTAPRGKREVVVPAYHEELNPLKVSLGANGTPALRPQAPSFNLGFIPQTYCSAVVTGIGAGGQGEVNAPPSTAPSYAALEVLDLSMSRASVGSMAPLKVLGAYGLLQGGTVRWTVLGVRADDALTSHLAEVLEGGAALDPESVSDPVVRQTVSNALFWLRDAAVAESSTAVEELGGGLLPPAAASALVSIFHKAWANYVFNREDTKALFGLDVMRLAFPGPWRPHPGWTPPTSAACTEEQAAVYAPAVLPPPDASAFYASPQDPSLPAFGDVTTKPVFEGEAANLAVSQASRGEGEGAAHTGLDPSVVRAAEAAAADADAARVGVKVPGAAPAQPVDVPVEEGDDTFTVLEVTDPDADIAADASGDGSAAVRTGLDLHTASLEEVVAACGGDTDLATAMLATQQAQLIQAGNAAAAAELPAMAAAVAELKAARSKRAAAQAQPDLEASMRALYSGGRAAPQRNQGDKAQGKGHQGKAKAGAAKK